MTIQGILNIGIEKLESKKIEDAKSITRYLLSSVLKKDKSYLVVHADEEISNEQENKFFMGIEKLASNIPLQYVVNHQEFMKLPFYVDENVLIPRQDTEIVVEEANSLIKANNYKTVLDLCTGSGAIAISIAKYTNVNVVATDISKEALEVARKNAKTNEVDVKFIESDMFEKIEDKFDLIISNPPYIKTSEMENLQEIVKKEPKLALDGDIDGLKFYRIIAENAYKHLNENGSLVLEIGFDQKQEVTDLLKENYTLIECKKDLGQNDRVIMCKRKVE